MTFPVTFSDRLAWAGLLALVLTACGKKGAPLPPVSRGPLSPQAVSARQLGRTVRVGFELPGPRGSKPGQQVVRAELVRVAYLPGLDPVADPDAFHRRGETVGSADGLPETGRFFLEDQHLDRLEDQGIGWTLRYAVRLRDLRGRPSVLVAAHDLVPLPSAAAPGALRAEPTAEGVRLTWEPGSASQPYNVYRSLPGAPWPELPLNPEPLAVAEYLDRQAEVGHRYSYSIRTVLAPPPPYREGEPSAIGEVVAEDRFAPAAPRGIVAVQEGSAVRLFWNPNHERDVAGYRVYRRPQGGEWQRVGPELVQEAGFLDREVHTGEILRYRVTAVDRTDPPNESPPSDEVEVELLAEPVVSRKTG